MRELRAPRVTDLVGNTAIGEQRKSLETEGRARAVAKEQLTASHVSGRDVHSSMDAPLVSFTNVFALARTRQSAFEVVDLGCPRVGGRSWSLDGRQLSTSERGARTCIDASLFSGFHVIFVKVVAIGRLE